MLAILESIQFFRCLLCNCNFSAFIVALSLLQVRTKLSSLEGIVPASHGFMIGSTGMKNVWLSMDHQSILWCNQLVVQVHWSKYIFFKFFLKFFNFLRAFCLFHSILFYSLIADLTYTSEFDRF